MLHVQRRERDPVSALIKSVIASSLPWEHTLTVSLRAAVKFSTREGGRNVEYLHRVRERGRDGENLPTHQF